MKSNSPRYYTNSKRSEGVNMHGRHLLSSDLFNDQIRSEPESSGVFKERDESAVDMTSHDGLDPAQEFAAHEDGRDGLAAGGGPRELEEEGVDLAAVGVAVELHDGGADPEAEEELFHHVAHAAAAEGEDHHRVAGGQEADPLWFDVPTVQRWSTPKRQ
nr:hypothetical protein DM860_007927 [Ipomoea batatas]